MHFKMSSGKWRPFCLGLNELNSFYRCTTGLVSVCVGHSHRSTFKVAGSQWKQATGRDAWASKVKCPVRFVSYLHEICIYTRVVYNFCLFCCLFIAVTWWYVWCIVWASGKQEEVTTCLVTLIWLAKKQNHLFIVMSEWCINVFCGKS